MKKILNYYLRGLILAIAVFVILAIISLIIGFAEPIDVFLKWLIPENYLLPGSGIIIVLIVIPLALAFLTKGKAKKYFSWFAKKIPVLSIFFREGEIPTVIEEAIPVAVKISGSAIMYGFLTGKSEVQDDSGFVKSKKVLCVVPFSAPLPFTSAIPIDTEPENVREVEIVGDEGRNPARLAIIKNKCLFLGQPLAPKIKYKRLVESEIEKLPVLSGNKKLKLASIDLVDRAPDSSITV